MKFLWRLCSAALIVGIIATNAAPYVALAAGAQSDLALVGVTEPQGSDAYGGTSAPAVAIGIQNNGSSALSVTSVTVSKAGTAPDSVFTGFTAEDDSHNTLGTADSLGSDDTVSIPVSVSIAPGAQQMIVVYASLASNVGSAAGSTFTLSVTAVQAAADVSGTLPVAGGQYVVTVGSPPPTCTLSLSSTAIAPGDSVTLTWASQYAAGGSITGVGPVGPSGSINLLPSTSQSATTFAGTFTGLGGTAQCSATVQLVTGGSGGGTGGTVTTNTAGTGGTVTTNTAGTGGTVTTNTAGNTQTITSNGGGSAGYTGSSNTGGLVPCGASDAQGTGQGYAEGCQACDLASLAQNIINFAIGLAIPIAAALFAYAGILYITSAAKPGNINTAKQIFKSAFIGFLIAITAWLVVNTLLHVLFAGNQQIQGNWFTINCSTPEGRVINSSINNLLSSLPGVNTTAPPVTTVNNDSSGLCSSTSHYDASVGGCLTNSNNDCAFADCGVAPGVCPSGSYYDSSVNGCLDNTYNTCVYTDCGTSPTTGVGSGTRGQAQCANGNTNCDVATLEAAGLTSTQANVMSCIAVTENSGNAVGCSGTGPCGTFQISQTNWKEYAPSQCQAINFGNSIVNAQNNAQCNTATMVNLVQSQGYQPWTCPGCNAYAQTCVNNYGG